MSEKVAINPDDFDNFKMSGIDPNRLIGGEFTGHGSTVEMRVTQRYLDRMLAFNDRPGSDIGGKLGITVLVKRGGSFMTYKGDYVTLGGYPPYEEVEFARLEPDQLLVQIEYNSWLNGAWQRWQRENPETDVSPEPES